MISQKEFRKPFLHGHAFWLTVPGKGGPRIMCTRNAVTGSFPAAPSPYRHLAGSHRCGASPTLPLLHPLSVSPTLSSLHTCHCRRSSSCPLPKWSSLHSPLAPWSAFAPALTRGSSNASPLPNPSTRLPQLLSRSSRGGVEIRQGLLVVLLVSNPSLLGRRNQHNAISFLG